MPITIDPALQPMLPAMQLGVVQADPIVVQPHDPALWAMLDELSERLRVSHAGKSAADRAEIAATRRAYRALGDDPTHYRPANEALVRRALSRRAFPQINTVVDINNYVSLDSGFALGCYDLAQVRGDIVARRGASGEQYAPIGKPAVAATHRLVLADDAGIFGSPTADGQRTMVTLPTRAVLFVIFAFEPAPQAVNQALDRTVDLLQRFARATITERTITGADHA